MYYYVCIYKTHYVGIYVVAISLSVSVLGKLSLGK